MSFVDFLTAHWSSILVVLVFVLTIIILAVKGKKDIIYKMLYTLVTEAEERYGSGEGATKFAEVMTRIYSMLPLIIRIFITYSTLERWIEEALKKAKAEWAKRAGIEPDIPKEPKGFSE